MILVRISLFYPHGGIAFVHVITYSVQQRYTISGCFVEVSSVRFTRAVLESTLYDRSVGDTLSKEPGKKPASAGIMWIVW
jgi:hypothetical protein